MLRTQEAALHGIGPDAIAVLCEAICLDTVEVVAATRVSIWFFDDNGDMVCQRLLDAREGRFQYGAVIPRKATAAYVKAAAEGLGSLTTDDAPALPADGRRADEMKDRLDLLLVGSQGEPVAIFRCERATDVPWSDRDIRILRNLAQTLVGAIRRESERYAARQSVPAVPSVLLEATGSTPQNLSWLRREKESSIWLQSVSAQAAFDALALKPPVPALERPSLPQPDLGYDLDAWESALPEGEGEDGSD